MLKNFRCYERSVILYKELQRIKCRGEIRDQLHRASLSVVLNLSEGYGRKSPKDRARFYWISFSSLRETQALLALLSLKREQALADQLAASIYCLLKTHRTDHRSWTDT